MTKVTELMDDTMIGMDDKPLSAGIGNEQVATTILLSMQDLEGGAC
mgnify:CR=1 FL=1